MVIFNSYVSHYQRVYVGTSNLGSSFAVLRFDQFLLTDPDLVLRKSKSRDSHTGS